MKKFILLLIIVNLSIANAFSQDKEKLYDPEVDAEKEIATAIKKATAEKKHIILQVGGNWCSWCIQFHNFCKKDEEVSKLLTDNYLIIHLNYSKENKNEALLKKYRYPQRFGFPVFVVLDEKGKYLHTQNSVYLEEGKGYSKKEIMGFLKAWTYQALDPTTYEEKK